MQVLTASLFLLQPESVCSFEHESTLSRIDIDSRYRFVGYAHRDRIAAYSDRSDRRPQIGAGIDPEGFWLCTIQRTFKMKLRNRYIHIHVLHCEEC